MEAEPPITDRTKAINQGLEALQDVTKEIREIRRLLEASHEIKQNRWLAFLRALKQLLSQL